MGTSVPTPAPDGSHLPARHPLPALTFSRFVAAFAVVLYHFGAEVWPIDVAPWNRTLRIGLPAVTFFFVLSGYVMARAHADITLPAAPSYWRARVARIYPVYLMGLLGTVLVSHGDWPSLASQVLLLQAWVPRQALAWNWVGWSLSVEVFFYLLFPALAAAARRMGPPWWTAASLSAWTGTLFWTATLEGWIEHGGAAWLRQFIDYFPPHHLASFLAGMTVAMLSRGLPSRAVAAWISLLAGFGLTEAMLALNGAPTAHHVPLMAFVPGFSLLIFGLAGLDIPSTWRPLTFLGEASYAVYVLQVPLALLVVALLPGRSPGALLSVFLPSLLALSCLVFACYETPLRRMIRGRVRGGPDRPARASPR